MLLYLVVRMLERALQIVEKVQSGAMAPDVVAIMQAVSSQSDTSYLLEITPYIFFVCWVIGIIDSWRIGCARDNEAQNNN